LGRCGKINEHKIYPYVNTWSNNIKFENQTKCITIPDVSPFEFLNTLSNFSMAAGDFLEIYNEKGI